MMRKTWTQSLGVWLGAALLSLTLVACQTVNPATGKSDFTPFMSPADEIKIGQQEHPNVTEQFGGVYDNPDVGGYVAAVGGRLAANSEMPDLEFTFTVLNSPIVNAFALPGGYIYVTRGILSLFNSEAEMASVLGHEIGHVTARHSAKRYNRSMFAGILGAGLGIALKNQAASELFAYGSQVYLLGYSRDQEYQSDQLGVRYMSRAGYDPFAAADMLRALEAQDALEARMSQAENRSRPPEFFSTHPNTANRVAEAEQHASDTGLSRDELPRLRDRYLDALDGMLYGDDPEQGLIRGRTFWHPGMRFTFDAPEGYRLVNSSSAVLAQGTNGDAGILTLSTIADGTATSTAMSEAWQQNVGEVALGSMQNLTINGMDATTAVGSAQTQNGEVTVRIVTIRYEPTRAFHFLLVTPVAMTQQLEPGLMTMARTFRKLSADEADDIKPLRLQIVTVQGGDTVESMAGRMAYDDYQVDRFRMLNGLGPNDTLKAGDRVKIVVSE